jgi:hypothetical protein
MAIGFTQAQLEASPEYNAVAQRQGLPLDGTGQQTVSGTPMQGGSQALTNNLSSPTGLPTPANVAADAPLPLQSFGATPTVTPSYASATTMAPSYASADTVNPATNYGYLDAQLGENAASLAPTFQAQQQSSQDQLAARGISSSGAAADLTNQLYGQQAATLAGIDASAIGQQAGYVQQDIQGNQSAINTANLTNAGYANAASNYNATNAQQTNLFNAGEGTAASDVNAQYYDQAVTGNATTYNNYLNTIENQGYNTSNEAYTAYLNSFDPSSGVTSAYDNAVSGIGNAATGAYDSSVQGEGTALGGLFGGIGTALAKK